MNVLGIESSCDETAAAVVQDGRTILSNVIASQEEIHGPYGGVVPELASRRHVEIIDQVCESALHKAGMSMEDIDLIAVTQGPGLIGSLIIGISFAQALSYRYNLPIVGINHLEGHLIAAMMDKNDVQYPVMGLIVSGGHTILVKMDDFHNYSIIGQTVDDAAGEAFDKVAMMMGLGYPGGPVITRRAKNGNPKAVRFPRGMVRNRNFDFSFSGLKTAVLYQLRKEPQPLSDYAVDTIAASFQEAVVDVLCKKMIKAAHHYQVKTLTIGGGVARNPVLRERLNSLGAKHGYKVILPDGDLCTDNAAMIAAQAYHDRDEAHYAKDKAIEPKPNFPLHHE
ncbi:MAG: tRNA (adenosine(37)-N6)-threonylcarbamoyltransferase complex transferase subunit TsaD [Candidatus Auribacterota bacterium]